MSTDERSMTEMLEPVSASRRGGRRKGPARPRKWTRPSERARPAPEPSEQPLGENEIEEAISAADIQFRKVQQEIRRRIAERAEAARLAHLAADERREAAVSALQNLAHANDERRTPARREDDEDEIDAPERELFVRREPADESDGSAPRVTAGFLLFTSLCTAASAILVNGFVTGTWPLIDVMSDRQTVQTPAVTIVAEQPAPPTPPAVVPAPAPPAASAPAVQPTSKAAAEESPPEPADTARAIQSWAINLARPAPPVPAEVSDASAAPPVATGIRATAGMAQPLPASDARQPEAQVSEQPAGEVKITPAATVAEQITAPGSGSTSASDTIDANSGQERTPAAEQEPASQVEASLQSPAAAVEETPPGTVSQADQLIKSGQTYLSHGDIASARLYFERAAELGDVRALIGLARTYDPVIFEQLGVFGMKPDPEKAMVYYLKARAAGSPDALAGIDALALYFGR